MASRSPPVQPSSLLSRRQRAAAAPATIYWRDLRQPEDVNDAFLGGPGLDICIGGAGVDAALACELRVGIP